MKLQVVVIGLGRFGESVATTLHNMGHEVLAIDKNEETVRNVATSLPHVIQADATNEAVLKELEITNFDVAIVAMGAYIEGSVLSTILLKKLGVKRVIARADDLLHGSILERIGAEVVVYPERDTGVRVAHRMMLSDVSDYMWIIDRYGIAKLMAPPQCVGQKLSEIGFGPRGKSEVAVLLIQRKNEVIVSPRLEETIQAGDMMVLAGNDDKVEQLLSDTKKSKNINKNQE